MESNLTKEDLARIDKIEKYLLSLNKAFYSTPLFAIIPKFEPFIAPIEQVEEVEYKVMLSECGLSTTKGRIYECYYQKGEDAYTIIDDLGNRNRGWDVGCFSHSKSTREAYLSQQEQPKEEVKERWKPKFGDRYYTIDLVGTGIDIRQRMWAEKTTDFNNNELGNCFKTEQEAQSAANKIKALLQTL